jgi:hypothetical protein
MSCTSARRPKGKQPLVDSVAPDCPSRQFTTLTEDERAIMVLEHKLLA